MEDDGQARSIAGKEGHCLVAFVALLLSTLSITGGIVALWL